MTGDGRQRASDALRDRPFLSDQFLPRPNAALLRTDAGSSMRAHGFIAMEVAASSSGTGCNALRTDQSVSTKSSS
jgi:hypothetical protein